MFNVDGLLGLHIKDSSKVQGIAEKLNKSFYHHGYPVGFKEAKMIGLPVTAAHEDIEEKIWKVWQDIEKEMECDKPFNPIELVINNPNTSPLLAPVPQIQIPANLPPQIAQQAYNSILQQIQIIGVPLVDYNLFQATLECKWCKSEFHTKGKISAVRLPDMNIAVNVLPISSEWTFSENKGT